MAGQQQGAGRRGKLQKGRSDAVQRCALVQLDRLAVRQHASHGEVDVKASGVAGFSECLGSGNESHVN